MHVCCAQTCEVNSRADISYLASEQLQGRVPGTDGDSLARQYIKARFQKLGYHVREQEVHISVDGNSVVGFNIIASIEPLSKPRVLIGAHYDHLGPFSSRSRDLKRGSIHFGADDNASGIALLLQLAEAAKDSALDVQFVAFAGHEDGLYGSKILASSIEDKASAPELMINLDMVGRLNPSNPVCLIYEKAKGISFSGDVEAASEETKLRISFIDDTSYNSDDLAFAEKGIPTLYFTTGIHSDHHRSSDTIDKINFEGLCLIEGLISRFLSIVLAKPNLD